jgi:hypothetical protein
MHCLIGVHTRLRQLDCSLFPYTNMMPAVVTSLLSVAAWPVNTAPYCAELMTRSITHTHALPPHRCRDVMWALQRFGIRLVDSVMARAALARDGADVPPEWVLDVPAVTETQVRRVCVCVACVCVCQRKSLVAARRHQQPVWL